MKPKFYLFAVVLFFSQICVAQSSVIKKGHYNYNSSDQSILPDITAPNSTGQSGTGSNIDVVYHRINWTVDPNSVTKTITGTVVTYFKTLAANVASIKFDLNSTSFPAASVTATYHGTACVDASASNILTITLPSTIVAVNTLDSVVVNYTGVPPARSGSAEGYQTSGAAPDKWIYTLSESYEDKDWWPCKADMQDKIDSMEINVTVPWNVATADTFWVATNGKLVDSTITGSNRTFKFKTHYPIASYLVCLGVAKYKRFYRSVNIGGTNTQIVFYILRSTSVSNTNTAVTNMDKVTAVLSAFSNKFGDYPFKLEKHGFYEGLGAGAGGMEHQTFSAIATGAQLSDIPTLVHELMHQWFGDNVTFATWNDLWLAEGFAQYSEPLAYELAPSIGAASNAFTLRDGFKTSALALNTASAWIPNSSTANSNLVWGGSYGSTVYKRGAMVVSMLRALCGDAKFFQACTNYQTALAGKSATTDSLKNHFNAVLGTDIAEFFKDYVGGSGTGAIVGGIGNPINQINWNSPSAQKLVVQVGGQTRTAGSNVTYFNGPVVLHVTNAATGWTKDTTIVFFDWGGGNLSYAGNGLSAPVAGNLLSYNLSFTPTNVFYDDSSKTLSTGPVPTKLATLALKVENFSARKTGTANEINLSLASIDNITKVELQKSSNGTDFITAGQMNLINSANQNINYQFTDANPFSSTTFYRAKIYYASKEEFTNIVKVQSVQSKGIVVSPNPAKADVKISFTNVLSEEIVVTILNTEGQKVMESSTSKNFIHFDTGNLPSGVYVVQVMQQGKVSETSKFLVRH
jgi:Peptidase family M1 domain/Secretion system C-terminal sorting domain